MNKIVSTNIKLIFNLALLGLSQQTYLESMGIGVFELRRNRFFLLRNEFLKN